MRAALTLAAIAAAGAALATYEPRVQRAVRDAARMGGDALAALEKLRRRRGGAEENEEEEDEEEEAAPQAAPV
jgi:phage baseplate assembly protein W